MDRLSRVSNIGREEALTIIAFTGGTGGDKAVLCGLSLHTYSDRTPLIQQADITAEQITCRLVEGGRLPPDDEILMAMKS